MNVAIMRVLFALAIGLVLTACHEIRRTNPTPCIRSGPGTCTSTWRETGNGYDLSFIDIADNGKLADQRQLLAANVAVKSAVAQTAARKALIILFVHGWFHSDAADDRDVERARKTLRFFASQKPDWVVEGVYVGWHGYTSTSDPSEYTSFYSRERYADNLAAHALPEIIDQIERGSDLGQGDQFLIIGHSFGGRAVLEATSEKFRQRLAAAQDAFQLESKQPGFTGIPSRPVQGVGSLVVLLEPAVAATAYVKLFNDANKAARETIEPNAIGPSGVYALNDRPLLVSITSDGDTADGDFFPISRFLHSIDPGSVSLETWNASGQNSSVGAAKLATHTLGNVPAVVTHRMEANGSTSGRCGNTKLRYAGFASPAPERYELPAGWLGCAAHAQALIDGSQSGALYDMVLPESCIQIRHKRTTSGQNPYWNVSVHIDVVQAHSEFMNHNVVYLFNQLLFSPPAGKRPLSECRGYGTWTTLLKTR